MLTVNGAHGDIFVDHRTGEVLYSSPCRRAPQPITNIAAYFARNVPRQHPTDFEPHSIASKCTSCGGFGHIMIMWIDLWRYLEDNEGSLLTNGKELHNFEDLDGCTLGLSEFHGTILQLRTVADLGAAPRFNTSRNAPGGTQFYNYYWKLRNSVNLSRVSGITKLGTHPARLGPLDIPEFTTQSIITRAKLAYGVNTAGVIHESFPEIATDSPLGMKVSEGYRIPPGINRFVSADDPTGRNLTELTIRDVFLARIEKSKRLAPIGFMCGVEFFMKYYEEILLPVSLRLTQQRRRRRRKVKVPSWERVKFKDKYGGIS